MTRAVDIQSLSHRYGQRLALDQLTLAIEAGEIFAFLGPNGGGKTTLFRLLSTYLPVQQGEFSILGNSHLDIHAIRPLLGVVFQAPSLDGKLTVQENLACHAALYGVDRARASSQISLLLATLGVESRRHERVDKLSGGLKRRVELAKSMLHSPRLLLMDEPSTGLDPGARLDLWKTLQQLRQEQGVTVVMTTHLLEEADKADRVAILHQGHLAALGSPSGLKAEVGGQSLTIEARAPEALSSAIAERFALPATVVAGSIRIETPQAAQWVSRLAETWPEQVESIKLGQPTLEDVFIRRTGDLYLDA